MIGRIFDYVFDLVCDTVERIPFVYDNLQTFIHKSVYRDTDTLFGFFLVTIIVLCAIIAGTINFGTQNMYYVYLSIVWFAMVVGGIIFFLEYQAKTIKERQEEEVSSFPVADIFAGGIVAMWIFTILHIIGYISSLPVLAILAL